MFSSGRSWIRSLVACIGVIPLLATVSGCGLISAGSGGGTQPGGGDSDAVNLNVLYDFASAGARKCTGSFTWTYTPISLTGSTGRSEQIVDPQSYDVTSDASDRCVFRAGELGLKKGTWRVRGTLTGECDVDLQDTATVTFRQGTAGCAKFP
jgi:hypothetical protein